MSGSIWGKNFRVSTFGESHGKAVGCIVDGCPSGIELDELDIYDYLCKRKPGKNYTSKRTEEDRPIILSGVYNGITLGTPIAVIVRNNDQISRDYSNLENIYRPSHADICYEYKYGIRDHRGGGRASGRETIGRVIAGSIANKILKTLNVKTLSYVHSIGNFKCKSINLESYKDDPLFMPDNNVSLKCQNHLKTLQDKGESIGGSIITIIDIPFIGIGEPVFEKLDSLLCYSIMSIGGVKAVEFGIGTKSSIMYGSNYNDEITYEDNKIRYGINNSGGILGGMSNSDNIIIKSHFKPTPSISKTQKTINNKNQHVEIEIGGRHDPTIVIRSNIVVTSMVNITLVDLLFSNLQSNINNIKKIYNS